MKELDILECTLRDGSYMIDYQFTAKDTAIISAALQNAGFRYIEIGHGLGLNASSCKGKAAETDEVYLRTAQEILTKAKYGMFFIPGIGRKRDLDLAAKYDMHFVRVGTNITQAHDAKEYIKYAKDLGMIVSSNLMKSYALPPNKFAEKAKLVEKFGADIITLVDSAGGMLPKDVREYINAMRREEINAKIGFHGHNNFSMAIANTLEAIENGASIIDSTLMGIGRSAGNTPTEILITIFKKMGYELNIDIFKTMDIAEELIKPIMKVHGGINSIAITSGYAEFHSSFLNTIYKASKKYFIDPRRLIISVCEKDKVNVPEELAMELAKQLHEERAALSEISRIDFPAKFKILRERWDSTLSLPEKSKILANYIKNLSIKKGKQTIFVINISAIYDDLNIVLPYIYESSSYLMANCEMTDKNEIIKIVKNVDSLVDFIVVDGEKKRRNLYDILKVIKEKVKKSTVLTYKGDKTWVEAIDNVISALWPDLFRAKVGIMGMNNTAIKLATSLSERGAKVFIFDRRSDRNVIKALNRVKMSNSPFEIQKSEDKGKFSVDADILVGLDRKQRIDKQMVKNMNKDGVIIDAIFGSLTSDAICFARNNNIKILRIDMKAAMAGEMTTVLRTYNMLKNIGKDYIGNIPIISPTYIGEKGDIVVDSILSPTEVIGVADGRGNIIYDKEGEYSEPIKKVEVEIVKRKIGGGK